MKGRRLVVLIALVAGATGSGCSGESPESMTDGGGETSDAEGDGSQAAVTRDPSPLGNIAKGLRRDMDGATWRGPLEEVLGRWRGKRQPMTDLLRETYKQRGYRPVFLDGFWPSDTAAALVQAVREVPSHGLPHSPYRPKALIPLYDSLALDPSAAEGTLTPTVGDNERLAKLEAEMPRSIYKRPRKSEKVPEVRYRPIRDLPELEPVTSGVRCLLDITHDAAASGRAVDEPAAAKCRSGAKSNAAAAELVKSVIEERAARRAELALLDAMLLQAYYTWVIDFDLDYRVHPFKANGPSNRERLPRENRDVLIKTLEGIDDAAQFRKALLARIPDAPEYDRTREAFARYVGYLDESELDELRATGRLEKGDNGDAVKALQRRLAAEDYYDGEANGDFDEVTHDGVVRFQKNHQLAAGGVVEADTVEALNIPFEWRIKQLMVSLGRSRESAIHRRDVTEMYIRVNIPAFELRVVENGDITKIHKVIVGSDRRFEDPINEITWHARRTKLFDTTLNEVVLNPTWIVPAAIVIDEIEPKARANPMYLENNNFRKVGDLLVQGPGATNPLGVVKFSLESTDAIYLHDTDDRTLFREVVRAFSHGCIRVHEPVKFAKFLLHRQGVTSEKIDGRIEAGGTLPIKVESPIPIFVEYDTVGVNETGDVRFFRDIYSYDVGYWKKRTPITRRFP